MSGESNSERSVPHSDEEEEGGTDTETLTCPRNGNPLLQQHQQLLGIPGEQEQTEDLNQSITDALALPPIEFEPDSESDTEEKRINGVRNEIQAVLELHSSVNDIETFLAAGERDNNYNEEDHDDMTSFGNSTRPTGIPVPTNVFGNKTPSPEPPQNQNNFRREMSPSPILNKEEPKTKSEETNAVSDRSLANEIGDLKIKDSGSDGAPTEAVQLQMCMGNLRERMSEYRDGDKNNQMRNGSNQDDVSNGKSVIGGDVQFICNAVANVIPKIPPNVNVAEPNGRNENEIAEGVPPASGAEIPAPDEEDAASRRPDSVLVGSVGTAPGSGEKKKKGTRLPLPLPRSQSGPHPVSASAKKLLPSLSPLGYKSPLPEVESTGSVSLQQKQKPQSAKAKLSPVKASPSPSSTGGVSAGKSRVPPVRRAQTARPARPEDTSPLAATALDLHLDLSGTKRSSSDLSRLLKPTASCSAKYTVGSSASTRASPSKSLGDNRLRRSTSMMGDAGSGSGGGSPSPTPGGAEAGASGEPAVTPGGGGAGGIKEQFTAFSKFGDATSDGKQITLSNADKWMKQAHVVDGKKITTTDTSITFKKLFKTSKKVGFEDFKRYVEDLAKSKGMEGKDVLDKLAHCGAPGLSHATKAAHAGVVSRLTDTSKYTGSHKERFDATGKGRGIEGRRDVADNSGYVAAFKGGKPGETQQSPTAK